MSRCSRPSAWPHPSPSPANRGMFETAVSLPANMPHGGPLGRQCRETVGDPELAQERQIRGREKLAAHFAARKSSSSRRGRPTSPRARATAPLSARRTRAYDDRVKRGAWSATNLWEKSPARPS